jgi:hypothetical protein
LLTAIVCLAKAKKANERKECEKKSSQGQQVNLNLTTVLFAEEIYSNIFLRYYR